MSETSPILALPYIQPAQAQKHVTHNEGMRILDAVAQLSVISVDLSSPPATADVGDRYVVGSVPLGAWVGQEGSIAVFDGSGWSFLPPVEGWIAWVEDITQLQVFTGVAWISVPGFGGVGDTVGINTGADTTNRLAVSAAATLLTHEGAGHQLKINKSTLTDTASLLFQTGFSGRAEMGIAGNDDFEIKVSPDGSAFFTGLQIDGTDGAVLFPQGAFAAIAPQTDPSSLMTLAEVQNYDATLVRNGLGGLGAAVNTPNNMTWDSVTTPNVPASLVCAGHFPGRATLPDPVPVDPNRIYQLDCYVRQESVAGDWSAFANGERHDQYMGLVCLDRDGLEITPNTHMRYRDGTTDSLTTLAAPLQPGDTEIHLVDASGWNNTSSGAARRGVIVFGYKDSQGQAYDYYSRYVQEDLFDLAGVSKTTHVITLNQPFPAALGNPDDVDGAWPVGTAIANAAKSADKYSFFGPLVLPETDRWYKSTTHIGGVDRSGADLTHNFAPGTAAVQIFWFPNQTNRPGGYNGAPDTGNNQKVWFAGIGITAAQSARLEVSTTAGEEGGLRLMVPTEAAGTGALSMADSQHMLQPLDAPSL